MLFARSLLFALLVPGTVVVLIPYAIATNESHHAVRASTPAAAASLVLIAVGAAVLVWCIVDFARSGRGTLAPIDPPTKLVRTGLYRYVRNPMYLGALLVLLGQTAFFRSTTLLIYTAIWFVCANLFVLAYEEPELRRQFGSSYDAYCRAVGRWLPGKPFDAD